MKIINLLIYLFVFVGLSFSQSNKKHSGTLLLNVNGGYRGNLSSHSTPQLSFNGLIAAAGEKDRVICSPVWNFQGSAGYLLPKIPLSVGIQSGIQWNQNIHLVGVYRFQKDFPSKKIGFRTINFGAWVDYKILKIKNHALSCQLSANALYIPFNYADFSTNKNPVNGEIISKSGNDTISYTTAINSISNNVKISWQIEAGINYSYSISKRFDIKLIFLYQFGITNLLNTSAIFYNSTNMEYQGNSSFSNNKGDAICINLGINYKIPFYKNL